ncbi:MAG TPA: hypothetical protein VHB73_06270 [Alphaproteobacteria bacterium]|nr:hypothetical protein [Alphaproteobacteria bacterium]
MVRIFFEAIQPHVIVVFSLLHFLEPEKAEALLKTLGTSAPAGGLVALKFASRLHENLPLVEKERRDNSLRMSVLDSPARFIIPASYHHNPYEISFLMQSLQFDRVNMWLFKASRDKQGYMLLFKKRSLSPTPEKRPAPRRQGRNRAPG